MPDSTRKAAESAAPTTNDDPKAGSVADSDVPNPPPANAARVAQARYSEGEGWELGQRAPKDQWRVLNSQGQLEGKPLSKAPAGKYASQVAIKGVVVTNVTRAELGLDD